MAYYLSPIFNEQMIDANGDPLTGGKIYTYLAGTSTAAATYTSSAGSVAQANPIILNSIGAPDSPIWLLSGSSYKFVLKDSNDVTLRTIDNVDGINDITDNVNDEWVLSALTPTYLGSTSFSLAADQTAVFAVGRRLKTTNTAGTRYSTIATSSYATSVTTITLTNDSGTLDSGLSAVYYGVIHSTNPSLPDSAAVRNTMGISAAIQKQTNTAFTTAGTSTAFTLTPSPAITANTAGTEFEVTFNAAAGATPTLSVSGLTALPLKYRDNSGALQAVTSSQIPSGWVSKVYTDGTNWILLNPVETVVANLAGGTAGQVPYQTGAGATAFTNSVDYQAFTASGTWTKPTKGTRVFVEAWGAGGGGSAGGGGGGGGYRFKWFNMSDLTATVAVTIGTGGAVDTAGGNTTFAAFLTAYGGGSGAPANFGGGGGGGTTSAGASGSGTTGGAGGGGTYSTTAATNGTNFDCGATGPSVAGAGYNSYYGGGSGAYCSVAAAGGASVYGGGGGGTTGGTSVYGGAGGGTAAGTAPGGGGGTNGSTTGYAGARGECRVTVF